MYMNQRNSFELYVFQITCQCLVMKCIWCRVFELKVIPFLCVQKKSLFENLFKYMYMYCISKQ